MALFDDGYIESLSCVECLSLEEVGRMAFLDATAEAGLGRDGRIYSRTRQFTEDE